MIKYRTRRDKIEAVEVIRVTDANVFLQTNGKERREAKRSSYQNWFDTWEEAKSFLVMHAEISVEEAHMILERAKGKLGQLRGMREV